MSLQKSLIGLIFEEYSQAQSHFPLETKKSMNAKNPYCGQNYLVIDLSCGAHASRYSIRYTDDEPKVADNACKSSELWLRRIPAGSFMMGSPQNERGRFDDEEQHQVTLTRNFYIGIFPCTQRQYELVMGKTPSFFKGDDRPVEQVSYDDLRGEDRGSKWPEDADVDEVSFFGRLQATIGLAFDLPTEAEWEYACRAGTTTSLNSGKNLTSVRKSCRNLDALGWYNMNSDNTTHPVGKKKANAWGLYDMHGNVFEWCLDWYHDYPNAAVENPKGGLSGKYSVFRISRGGDYFEFNEAAGCRSAARNARPPFHRATNIGFRVAWRPS